MNQIKENQTEIEPTCPNKNQKLEQNWIFQATSPTDLILPLCN